MRPRGSPGSLEKRRRRAIELSRHGWGVRAIARRLQAAAGSVSRWIQGWKAGGDLALAAKPAPGRPKRLSERQRKELEKILLNGAHHAGFPNELWTLKRIATVIRREFGIRYHPSGVWRALQKLGWSCQIPERRAIQRDEQAIAQWKQAQWPAIKKSPTTWRPPRVSR